MRVIDFKPHLEAKREADLKIMVDTWNNAYCDAIEMGFGRHQAMDIADSVVAGGIYDE